MQPQKMYGEKTISNTITYIEIFTESYYILIRFNCIKELFLYCWRSYRENTFAKIELRSLEKSFLETDYLRVLGNVAKRGTRVANGRRKTTCSN